MNRTVALVFSIVALCSLTLVGIVNAGNEAYPVTEYQWATAPTNDGKWTTTTEWTDAPIFQMSNNSIYLYKIDFTTFSIAWMVESFGDNTNDAGDYWQICFDPDNSGGTAPQAGDFKIEITGHTTLKMYQGTGSGWTQISGANEILWANSMNTSRYGSANHWILEVQDPDKQSGTLTIGQPPNGMAVYCYDASTDKVSSWPPGSHANVPSEYGVINNYSMDPIPEGFSLGATLLIASVAMFAGYAYLRKRQKPAIVAPKTLT